MFVRLLPLFLAVVFFLQSPAFADFVQLRRAATAITVPYTGTGSLTTDLPIYGGKYHDAYAKVYKITLSSDQALEILLSSDDFDTYLYVLNGNGEEQISDDDCIIGETDLSCIRGIFPAGTYYILVSAWDEEEVGDFGIVIDYIKKPTFAEIGLENGVINEPYSGLILVGNSEDMSIDMKDASLPPDFELNCWGGFCSISGTPTTAGTFTFTFVATNIAGSSEKQYTFKIISELAKPVITTQALPSGVVGEIYLAKLFSESPAEWIVTSGDWPPNFELSGSVIMGIPQETGTYTFTVTATNTAGSTGKQFTITIGEGTPVIIPAATANANPLKAYMRSGTLYLSGLTTGKPWSIYTAKGTLLQSGVANGAEMNVKMNAASGVYFVRSNGQTLKIINK